MFPAVTVGLFASKRSLSWDIAVVYTVTIWFPELSVSFILIGISFPLNTSVPPCVTVNVAVYVVSFVLDKEPKVKPPIVPVIAPLPVV